MNQVRNQCESVKDTYDSIVTWRSNESGGEFILYQSGFAVADNLALLRELGIRLVINATKNIQAPPWLTTAAPAASTPDWIRVPVWRELYHGEELIDRFADMFARAWTLVAAKSSYSCPSERDCADAQLLSL